MVWDAGPQPYLARVILTKLAGESEMAVMVPRDPSINVSLSLTGEFLATMQVTLGVRNHKIYSRFGNG
jgi:hypothetical protein